MTAQRPDVLLLDHLRVCEADGRAETDASSPLLRGVTGVAPLADRPKLLGLQHAAWNRVVRREFLLQLGLRFFPGWYEDYPFSHPVLLAARGVAVLDRVCYVYRQRRTGAITRTVSQRHFEAFDQYDRLFDVVDRLDGRVGQFRPQLFGLMISHLLVIVGNDARVSASQRRAFFGRIAEHYRRYIPPGGYPMPNGIAALKHRIVRANAYPAYAALRHTYRTATRLPSPCPPSRPAPSPPAPSIMQLWCRTCPCPDSFARHHNCMIDGWRRSGFEGHEQG